MNSFALIFKRNKLKKVSKQQLDQVSLAIKERCSFEPSITELENAYLIQSSSEKKEIFSCDSKRFFLLGDFRLDNREFVKKKVLGKDNHSDEELIISAFKKHKAKCFSLFEGPFSLVILDTEKQEIFCARDFFGQRPLHYFKNGDFLIISSEIKPIQDFGVPKDINIQKIIEFILLDYKKDNFTFFKNINKLNGGKWMKFSDNKLTFYDYQNLPEKQSDSFSLDKRAKRFRYLFEEVISDQLKNTNNILSTTLSGGLDSSSISLLLDKYASGKEVNSISIHFNDLTEHEKQLADKKSYIRSILDKTNLDHEYVQISFNDASTIDFLENFNTFHFPYSMVNGYLHHKIFEQCRRANSSNLFDGLFGDEIISHGSFRLSELINRRKYISFLIELYHLKKNGVISSIRKQIISFIIFPIIKWLKSFFIYKRELKKEKNFSYLIKQDFQSRERYIYESIKANAIDEIEAQKIFFSSGLIEHVLEQLDYYSSRQGIECFYPFLDKRLVFEAMQIPTSMKLKRGVSRLYFREALKDIFPKQIYQRHTKGNLGFFGKRDIKNKYKAIIKNLYTSESNVNKLINLDRLKESMDEGFNDQTYIVFFNIYSLDVWLRNNNLSI